MFGIKGLGGFSLNFNSKQIDFSWQLSDRYAYTVMVLVIISEQKFDSFFGGEAGLASRPDETVIVILLC